jgi:hypothetical protein
MGTAKIELNVGDHGAHGYQQPMLVDDVKLMQSPQQVIPSTVRLESVNELFSGNRHTLSFSFRLENVLLGTIADREVNSPDRVPGITNQLASEMIEGAPKVMRSVASGNGQFGGHDGKWAEYKICPRLFFVEMVNTYIRVRLQEPNSFPVEITDVLFGPLNL